MQECKKSLLEMLVPEWDKKVISCIIDGIVALSYFSQLLMVFHLPQLVQHPN